MAPYEFSIDGGTTFHEEYTYINLPAGPYQLRARDATGCVYEYELKITDVPKLEVELPEHFVSCQDSVLLAFSIAPHPAPYTWYWTPLNGGTFSCDSLLWAKTSGHYRLTVENQCETFNGTIRVEFEKELTPQIYLPNSFSPNGDGVNDCFRAYPAAGLQLVEFQLLVFDRWGKKVFVTQEADGCWDGTVRGKELGQGVFAWFVIAKIPGCDGGVVEVFREGGIMLVR